MSTLAGADLLKRVTAPPASEKVAAVIEATTRAVRREALFSFSFAAAIVAGAAYLFETAPEWLANLRPWVAPLGVVVSGLVLYFIRLKFRLAYGVAEVLVGALTGWNVADTASDQLFPVALQILAAMYIIVRGIDNVAVGWPESKLNVWWRRFRGPYHAA